MADRQTITSVPYSTTVADKVLSSMNGPAGSDHTNNASAYLQQMNFFEDAQKRMIEDSANYTKNAAANAIDQVSNLQDQITKRTKKKNKEITSSTIENLEAIIEKAAMGVKTFESVFGKAAPESIAKTSEALTKLHAQITAVTALGSKIPKIIVTGSGSGNRGGGSGGSGSGGGGNGNNNSSSPGSSGGSNNSGRIGGVPSSIVNMFTAGGLGSMGGNTTANPLMSKLTGIAMKLLPTLAEGAAFAGMASIQGTTNELYKDMGTNTKNLNDFVEMLPALQVGTHQSFGQITELARAFQDVGIPISKTTEDLQGYLIVAGQASRLLNLSAMQSAAYVKALRAQGLSAREVTKNFDSLYRTMQKTGATTAEVSKAMTDASAMVGEFGGTSHTNVGLLTTQVLEAQQAFKGLGIEAKYANSAISNGMSDPFVAMRRSYAITQQLGGSADQRFMDSVLNPGKASQDALQAAMMQAQQMAPELSMTRDQLMAKFPGGKGFQEAFMRQQQALKMAGMMNGVDTSALQQGFTDLQGAGVGGNIQAWMAKRNGQGNKDQTTGWATAWNNYQSTMPELMTQLGRLGQNLMIIIGGPFMKIMIPVLTHLNSILDKLASAGADSSVVKMFGALAAVGLAMYAAFEPLVTLFKVFSGIAAMGGLSGIGIPMIIAGAITAGILLFVTGVGPKILQGLMDGAKAIIDWISKQDWWSILWNHKKDGSPVSPSTAKGPIPTGPIPGVPGTGLPPGWGFPSTGSSSPASGFGNGGSGAALRNNKDFWNKTNDTASKLGWSDPNWLRAIMSFESNTDPSKRNRAGSGATGLIQFMPSTARGLGTTTEALSKMSGLEQMDYVYKYLKNKGKVASLEDAYMTVLYPAAVGKGANNVLFSRGSVAYKQNAGLDHNGDGYITNSEAADSVRQQYNKILAEQAKHIEAIHDVVKDHLPAVTANQEKHTTQQKQQHNDSAVQSVKTDAIGKVIPAGSGVAG